MNDGLGWLRGCSRWSQVLLSLGLLLIPELLWAQEGSAGPDTRMQGCFQGPASLYPGRSTYWLLGDHEDPARNASVQFATQGIYLLQRWGGQVDATVTVRHATGPPLGETESDLEAGGAPVLFTIPAGYRPLHTISRWVEARAVRPDGSLWLPSDLQGTSLALKLQVDPLGAVSYRDVTKVTSLVQDHWGTPGDRWGFVLDTTWVTATSTLTGPYVHPDEPRSHYHLRHQSETGAATLTGLAAPVPRLSQSAEVLFTLPPGYRPLTPVTREVEGWPVHADGSLQEDRIQWRPVQMFRAFKNVILTKVDDPLGRQRWVPYQFTLQIAPDGAVRYGPDAAWEGVANLNYTLTTTWTTADTRWPTSAVTGMYDQVTVHHEGQYRLQRTGERVTVTMTTTRSPLAHPDVLFTVPADYRPATTVTREIVGQEVHAKGERLDPAPGARRFWVQVAPDGTVRYVPGGNRTGPAYVAYTLETTWGTTPLAGDRLALEALYDHNQEGFGLKPNPDDLIIQYPLTDASGQLRDPLWLRPDVPLGEWRGVTTNAEGRVIELHLHDLGGRLPAHLGDLTDLRELTVITYGSYSQPLTGTLPPVLEQLEVLRELRIKGNGSQGNGLQGPIPPGLGQLTHLEVLDLGFNDLQGSIPPELGQLTHLQLLDFSDNNLQGPIPPELGQLTHLQLLDLSDNNLEGPIPPELGQLTALKRLSLADNALAGPIPSALGQLSQLHAVYLNRNDLTGCVPAAWQPHRFFVRSGPYGEERVLPFCPN